MRRLALAGLALGLAACSTGAGKGGKGESGVTEPNPAFERGLRALERQEYEEAARLFDRILVTQPGTELELVTIYNSGAAYEGLGNCGKAAERFQEVVRASAKRFPRMEAEALFRLSLMYECLGQDTKTVAALLDARKQGKQLAPEVAGAEIPAHLAAAYSRLGNRDKALEYFELAGQGLKAIVARSTGSTRPQTELLARTLFLMGKLNPRQRGAEASPDSFLQSLSMQQPHLLQAVELNHPLYSPRAADDLELAYENIWKYGFAELQDRRRFYERGLQVARELRRLRLPEANPLVDEVYAALDKTEARLNAELAKLAVTTRQTPESEQREGLRPQGRLVRPAPVPSRKVRKK
jgi:tetratricopeptide (TPR) repeat protein